MMQTEFGMITNQGYFYTPNTPRHPPSFGTASVLSRVMALIRVCTMIVSIHQNNFSFAKRGQLEDLK